MIIAIITAIIINIIIYYICKKNKYKGYKNIPIVMEGTFIEHEIEFEKDIKEFIKKNYKKYGKIFRIKILKKNICIICDEELKEEFILSDNKEDSMNMTLNDIYFEDFSRNHDLLNIIYEIIKKTINIKHDKFIPIIIEETQIMIERLKDYNNNKIEIDLINELTKFVLSTNTRCFINITLNDKMYKLLQQFINKTDEIIRWTYIVPIWILRLWYRKEILNLKKKIKLFIIPIINEYRNNKYLNESIILRTAINYEDEKTKKKLTDNDIGEIIICLLYISSKNTVFGLLACLTNIAHYKENWDNIKQEIKHYLNIDNIKDILSIPILNKCVINRINNCIYILNKRPRTKKTIGQYYIGNIDDVLLCDPNLIMYDKMFKNKSNDFLGNDDIMLTWGSGINECPEKIFAINEIKIAIAFIIKNFENPKMGLNEFNYIFPSTFIKPIYKFYNNNIKFIPLINNIIIKNNSILIKINNKIKTLEWYDDNENRGWLIRNYLNINEQQELYTYTIELSNETLEHNEISTINICKAYSISYYNLEFTNTSNCTIPHKWFNISNIIMKELINNKTKINFPIDELNLNDEFTSIDKNSSIEEFEYIYNSMCAQLFHNNSIISKNKEYTQLFHNDIVSKYNDQFMIWEILFNLGASIDYSFGSNIIKIHSGDVFIADNNKEYGMKTIHENTIPGWFNDDNIYIDNNNQNHKINTFGRHEMCVQIRKILIK